MTPPRPAGDDGQALRISLFWRTFLMMALMICVSFGATLGIARLLDRTPPEQRLAWEIASVLNLTRSALVSADAARRLQLLDELAREENVRVLPLEASDRIDTTATGPRLRALEPRLAQLLGPGTRVAGRVNDQTGVWVSFQIDDDGYWLLLPRARVERQFGPSLGVLGLIAVGLSLIGALAISRLVNRPLAALAGAIDAVSRGRTPAPLAESGPTEIAALNRRFNRLAGDLVQLDHDRSLALAGISHDIRSPLTRLRMEIEMAGLSAAQHASMVEDIDRIDRIVGQFVQYARIAEPPRAERVDLALLLADVEAAFRGATAAGELQLSITAPDEAPPSSTGQASPPSARQPHDATAGSGPQRGSEHWIGDATDLQRVITNLIDNSMRYGRGADGGPARVELSLQRRGDGVTVELRDHGPGIPEADIERLLRPFARRDTARGEHEGAGLGLAIVERLARRYGGSLRLGAAAGGGLAAAVILPDHRPAPERDRRADAGDS
ncbi:MAG: ATP-binding protein [Burkholderiaceae bacterium]